MNVTDRPHVAYAPSADQRQWSARFPVVARMVDQGFWPGSYGPWEGIGTTVWPTKFYYSPGGMDAPAHVRQGEGARFLVWSFASNRPLEETAGESVWQVSGSIGVRPPRYRYRSPHGLVTLERAVEVCRAFAQDLCEHYIVPVWSAGDRYPALPRRQWWEVRDVALPGGQAAGQLDLFAPPPPPSREAVIQAFLRSEIVDGDPDEWVTVQCGYADMLAVDHLCDLANERRAEVLGHIPGQFLEVTP